ncbi:MULTISPECIES: outer membrane protein [unclassified Mesorhizobium]|uniref:outer membrane protein n=1 Tax=unclassified Mesorhizobium TaxID=325217 RepID=UPI00112C76DA|nr:MULTISPECIES: outer membrane protein [unclassified Mesorhizobium]TPK93487.1 porin family protein [Mesorhizobium sp. B2-4-16]TPL70188.1 porin family protein [Mesorhizobium sp. B2-4-3]
MNIANTIVLTGLVLGVAGVGINSAMAGDAAPSWSGAYIGANIGYGWDTGNADLLLKPGPEHAPPDFPIEDIQAIVDALNDVGAFPTSMSPSARGIVGGGQVGYNWQLPSNWVVGVEADLQASGIKGSETQRLSPQFFDKTVTTVSKNVDWYGTARVRAGYLVSPQWLVYATGGLAYGKAVIGFSTANFPEIPVPNPCSEVDICANTSSDSVRLGWALGAGIETMLAPNWSLKAEYLYVDLGKKSFTAQATAPMDFNVSAKFHEQTVRIGLNYHFE